MKVQEDETYLLQDEPTPASPLKETIGPTPNQKTRMFSEDGDDPQVSNFAKKITSPDQRKMYMELAMQKNVPEARLQNAAMAALHKGDE